MFTIMLALIEGFTDAKFEALYFGTVVIDLVIAERLHLIFSNKGG